LEGRSSGAQPAVFVRARQAAAPNAVRKRRRVNPEAIAEAYTT